MTLIIFQREHFRPGARHAYIKMSAFEFPLLRNTFGKHSGKERAAGGRFVVAEETAGSA
jgi:hypothetical protein